jgi:hypothetical protein
MLTFTTADTILGEEGGTHFVVSRAFRAAGAADVRGRSSMSCR